MTVSEAYEQTNAFGRPRYAMFLRDGAGHLHQIHRINRLDDNYLLDTEHGSFPRLGMEQCITAEQSEHYR
ncbi:MAG: hypothetical protein XU15_C0011G0104 [candidate division NC10 bacterium CSP1-5]|nr:MAG: hypothetical protein XU15_C0011G0104 [candidate division NC10 bacterium CSP1-5]